MARRQFGSEQPGIAAKLGLGFACFVAGWIYWSIPVRADECLRYEPVEVTVTGTLKWYWAYRRADFNVEKPEGERKHLYPVLILDKISCVIGGDPNGPDSDEYNVITVALYPARKMRRIAPSLKGPVTVRGKFSHTVSGGIGPVNLEYTSVTPTAK